MNADHEIEPIDVLLEEVLREPAAAARGPGWSQLLVAAALLLGIGAVVGVFVLRHQEPPVQKFLQTPQDPNTIAPKDRAEFDRLLANATALRVVRKQVVGSTREGPASERLDFEAWAQALEVSGTDLAAWRADIAASAAGGWGGVDACLDVRVLLPDGKQVECFATFALADDARTKAAFGLGSDELAPLQPSAALLTRLRAAHAELERQYRRANGIAHSTAELAELPEDSRRVDCPTGEPQSLRKALGRFTRLQELRLRQSAVAGAPPLDGAVLRAVAGLAVTRLTVDAERLTDADLAPLATMPSLKALTLRNGGAELTGSGFGAFAGSRLTNLAVTSCEGLTARGLGAISTLVRLQQLVLLQPNDATLEFGRTQLRTLPSLTQLIVWSERWTDNHLQGLLETKVAHLWLGETQVTAQGIERLGRLPSVATLVLGGTRLGDADVPAFAALKQCTELTVLNGAFTVDGVAALHEAMPECKLTIRPASRVLDVGYHLDPCLRD